MVSVEEAWRRAENVLVCSAGGESALLLRETWSVVQMDQVSRTIWDLLAEPKTTALLVRELREQFDVSSDQCRADILPVLRELREAGAVLGGD